MDSQSLGLVYADTSFVLLSSAVNQRGVSCHKSNVQACPCVIERRLDHVSDRGDVPGHKIKATWNAGTSENQRILMSHKAVVWVPSILGV